MAKAAGGVGVGAGGDRRCVERRGMAIIFKGPLIAPVLPFAPEGVEETVGDP